MLYIGEVYAFNVQYLLLYLFLYWSFRNFTDILVMVPNASRENCNCPILIETKYSLKE